MRELVADQASCLSCSNSVSSFAYGEQDQQKGPDLLRVRNLTRVVRGDVGAVENKQKLKSSGYRVARQY